MRILILSFLLMVSDAIWAITDSPPTYYIPAAGATHNDLDYGAVANQTIYVTTDGSINLGGNTYTLTYASLPPSGTTWNAIVRLDNLTVATKTNVNIFGETPLATFPGITTFYINFSVVDVGGVATKKVSYFGSLDDLTNFYNDVTFHGTVNFDGRANLNDSSFVTGDLWVRPNSVTINLGAALTAADTAGKITYGCVPWCTTGNSGLHSNVNFLGMIDTPALIFRVNNQISGIIDYNLANTGFGYRTLLGNTTGSNNTAVGYNAFGGNTSGLGNVAMGVSTMVSQTTANNNVGIGNQTLNHNVTGTENTSVGYRSGQGPVTGSYNTCFGSHADVVATSTHDGIALGVNTTAGNYGVAIGSGATASPNQLSLASIRAISIANMSSGINYLLTDTSGSGDFVSRTNPVFGLTTFTPVAHDSISLLTSQNDINPAGTLDTLTIILPASPISGFIYEFSTTQTLTKVLWSVRLSGGTTTALPSTLAQYGTIKIKWNATLTRWLNW